MDNVLTPHTISAEVAPKILEFLSRGPVALYRSVNLSNPGAQWLVPAGNGKPTWESANEPERLLTLSDFAVVKDIEVKRFHVAVRTGSQGFMRKVTDGGSRRIRAAVSKAGDGAYYRFDYETQEAVILKPEGPAVPLTDWSAS